MLCEFLKHLEKNSINCRSVVVEFSLIVTETKWEKCKKEMVTKRVKLFILDNYITCLYT